MPFLNFIEMGSPCVLWLFLAGRGVSPHHARPPPQDCAGCRGRGFWTQAWPLWAPSPPPHSEDLASCPAICHPEPCGWRGSSGGPAGTLPTWASPSGPTCQDLGQPPKCVDKKRAGSGENMPGDGLGSGGDRWAGCAPRRPQGWGTPMGGLGSSPRLSWGWGLLLGPAWASVWPRQR